MVVTHEWIPTPPHPQYAATTDVTGPSIDEHHRKCPRRLGHCSLCGILVEARDVFNHDENDCSERPVTCSLCQGRMPLSSIDEHRAKECCKREVECPLCSSRVKADILDKPQSFLCQNRLLSCPLGCGSKVKFCDLPRHRRHKCPRRTVRCRRCNDLLPLNELKQHEVDMKCGGKITVTI